MMGGEGRGPNVVVLWSGCGPTLVPMQVRVQVRVQVSVLGSASITDPAGRETARPERKARELLTLLVLRAPAAIALDELVDLLWDDPPDSAVRTIRAHMSRLRTALSMAGVAGEIQHTGGSGYRLVLPDGATDVDAVGDLRRRARHLLADGRADGAASILADARRLWRGDPELPDTAAATALTRGWRREHRQLVLDHLHCTVEGSDPSQALGELESISATDPTDEPVWVLKVRALHRSGNQLEAVRAVESARAGLAEVGLEPGADLRAAEAEVFGGATDRSNLADSGRPPPSGVEDPAIEYAVVDGRHVAYTVLSSGPRDLVVLNPAMVTIDGLLDETRSRHALERLGEHARVICIDRRGIGLSDPLDPLRDPLEEWTGDVIHVLDALGVDAAHVMASFDTGLIAIELAARHPERVASLVLAHCFARYHRGDGYPHGVDPATSDQLIRDAVSPEAPSHRIDTVSHAAPSVAGDEGFRRWWTRIGQRGAGPATATTIRTIATRTDLRGRLPGVLAPTLVVHRRSCLNVDVGHARYLAEHIPNAELSLVPGTDSLWFTDTPDLLDRTIEFLGADEVTGA